MQTFLVSILYLICYWNQHLESLSIFQSESENQRKFWCPAALQEIYESEGKAGAIKSVFRHLIPTFKNSDLNIKNVRCNESRTHV